MSRAIDIPTVFASFDDLWSPFLGGPGPGPVYVASLAEEPRATLRDRYRRGRKRARRFDPPDGEGVGRQGPPAGLREVF